MRRGWWRSVFLLCPMVLMLGGCMARLQPVVLFYMPDNALTVERLRVVARELSGKHAMRFIESPRRKDWDVDNVFEATRNSWFYHQGLARGDDADFIVGYGGGKLDLVISGPPNHAVVHALVDDWTSALDAAGIEYEKEVRQPLQPIIDR